MKSTQKQNNNPRALVAVVALVALLPAAVVDPTNFLVTIKSLIALPPPLLAVAPLPMEAQKHAPVKMAPPACFKDFCPEIPLLRDKLLMELLTPNERPQHSTALFHTCQEVSWVKMNPLGRSHTLA